MHKYLFLLLIFVLSACTNDVLFTEPQPEGSRDLKKFPKKYTGQYIDMEDSTILVIMSYVVLEEHTEALSDPLSEVLEDGDIEIRNDSMLFKDSGRWYSIEQRNDSVFGKVEFHDTLVDLSGSGKLRKLGRNFFVSLPLDSLWMVFKLSFDRDDYAYLCEVDKNEMPVFEQHCKVEVEKNERGKPDKYYLSPTRKELKTLLKLGTFSDSTVCRRIDLP